MQVQNQTVANEQASSAARQKSEPLLPEEKTLGIAKSDGNVDLVDTPEKGAAADKTSKYLKVLSRIENLLIQDALPEAAVKGFVGAVKKQLNTLTESEKQEILGLSEVKKLELNNLDDLPETIEEMLIEREDVQDALELLKQPRFAVMMLSTEARNSPGTYNTKGVQSVKTSVHKDDVKEPLKTNGDKSVKADQTSRLPSDSTNFKSMPDVPAPTV